MKTPSFILEVNTRVWLRDLGGGHPISLDKVEDWVLDRWQELGYDAVWLMGIWLPSSRSAEIARAHADLREEFVRSLPDLREDDITASPYAISDYQVNPKLGGQPALAAFRNRLRERGMRLILDFVPNHTATDHPWVRDHPDWYVNRTEGEFERDPDTCFAAPTIHGRRIIAHGRDPYFPAWSDTAQLDYANPELQDRLCKLLAELALICDGVRCDMAMLVMAEVFEKTWGNKPAEFWPRATRDARRANPDFFFMAEVYWDLDQQLREMGFDLTYDKTPLDRAVDGPLPDRALFDLPIEQHRQRVRFLENHDEPRIASRLELPQHFVSAVWLLSLPSTRLIYEGQVEGKQVRPPVQLLRAPDEYPDEQIQRFYGKLMAVLKHAVARDGQWRLLESRSAWHGNESHERILGQGYDLDQEHLRIFVNWADHRSQCWVDLHLGDLTGKEVELRDRLGKNTYVRDGNELMTRGLYLDLPAWEFHVFECG